MKKMMGVKEAIMNFLELCEAELLVVEDRLNEELSIGDEVYVTGDDETLAPIYGVVSDKSLDEFGELVYEVEIASEEVTEGLLKVALGVAAAAVAARAATKAHHMGSDATKKRFARNWRLTHKSKIKAYQKKYRQTHKS